MARPTRYIPIGLRSGVLYGPTGAFSSFTANQAGITYNTTSYYCPFFLPGSGTITACKVQLGIQGQSGTALKVALFRNTSGVPGTLAFNPGGISTNQAAGIYTCAGGSSSAVLEAGIYWLGWAYDPPGESFPAIKVSSDTGNIPSLGYNSSGNKIQYLYASVGYSSFPQSDASGNSYTAETGTTGRGAPAIWVSL